MRYQIILLTVLLYLSVCKQANPVIGIMMHPSGSRSHPRESYSQIPASYVKYAEMAGARVLPIHYDGDQFYYDEIFNQINGILFTGGSASFKNSTHLGKNSNYLFKKAIEANDNGDHFPIWGTCLGFEMILTFSQDFEKEILGDISEEKNVTRSIQVLDKGTLYSYMPQQILYNSENSEIQYYNHKHDVTPETYESTEKLKKFWRLLATSQNPSGKKFIASIEARHYPIFGTQFHPEKNSFEWKVNAKHTLEAISMEQYYADFFVEHSRQNFHEYPSEHGHDLIYKYTPEFKSQDSGFEQVYYFKNLEQHNSNEFYEEFQD